METRMKSEERLAERETWAKPGSYVRAIQKIMWRNNVPEEVARDWLNAERRLQKAGLINDYPSSYPKP